MGIKWTDTREIAIALDATHPEINPRYLNFVDLRAWVRALDGFDDDRGRCGEKILEAIQLAWIEERE
jgi:FeS assembly protein IscX